VPEAVPPLTPQRHGGRLVDRFQRIYRVDRILRARRTAIPVTRLAEQVPCGRATIYRILDEMQDCLGAPIVREHAGVRYNPDAVQRYELPGLWLNPSEIAALLALESLLERIEPGFLAQELAPLRDRLSALMARQEMGADELTRRVRILGLAHRRTGPHFPICAEALVARRRLRVRYRGRSRDAVSEREISPQRLVHYRDNWYLDAWCHASDGLRTFSLDRIEQATVLTRPKARAVSEKRLDAELATAYGILSGPAPHTAVLRFTAERARWVADERWHPEQRGEWQADGSYELRVPYGDPRELIGDVLRHGADIEVQAPAALRTQVERCLREAVAVYQS